MSKVGVFVGVLGLVTSSVALVSCSSDFRGPPGKSLSRCDPDALPCQSGQLCVRGMKKPWQEAWCVYERNVARGTYHLPIAAGTPVTCVGSTQNPGPGHDTFSSIFALDLASPTAGPAATVVAAREGKIVYVSPPCASGAATPCNRGLGNFVLVEHAGNEASLYAHLASVSVKVGDSLADGQPLGIEGSTGKTNRRAVHFSVHEIDLALREDGLVPWWSVPYLLTATHGAETTPRGADVRDLKCAADGSGTSLVR